MDKNLELALDYHIDSAERILNSGNVNQIAGTATAHALVALALMAREIRSDRQAAAIFFEKLAGVYND